MNVAQMKAAEESIRCMGELVQSQERLIICLKNGTLAKKGSMRERLERETQDLVEKLDGLRKQME